MVSRWAWRLKSLKPTPAVLPNSLRSYASRPQLNLGGPSGRTRKPRRPSFRRRDQPPPETLASLVLALRAACGRSGSALRVALFASWCRRLLRSPCRGARGGPPRRFGVVRLPLAALAGRPRLSLRCRSVAPGCFAPGRRLPRRRSALSRWPRRGALWGSGGAGGCSFLALSPGPPLRPGAAAVAASVAVGFSPASPPPLPPPLGALGEREASGLGGSRPRPSGSPCHRGCFRRCPRFRCFLRRYVSRGRYFQRKGLTFMPGCGTFVWRGPFRSFGGCPKRVSMDGWKTAWSKDQAVFLCALGFLLPPQNRTSDFPEVNQIYGARCCFFP